jgi:hypothetical protein
MLKIHRDGGGVVATTTSPSKAVSFGVDEKQPTRHNGRKTLTPLRTRNRKPVNSPYPNNKNDSSTLFKSPSSKTTSSNSFRQGLKKGCTPSSTKSKMRNNDRRGEENETMTVTTTTTSQPLKNRSQQQQQPKQLPKTPNSASALRRVLRGTTIQSEGMQQNQQHQQHNHPSEQIGISRMHNIDPVVSRKLTLANASRFRLSSGNNQQSLLSRSTVTVSTSSSLVAGRSRLIGKGGVAATGRSSLMSCLGPPKRVEPKTPNSLLRTELEDEDDDFDESLLMSPPPGALWNALNISSGGTGGGKNRHSNSPMVTTGLIIVSPQAAEEIHTWSSTKKKLSSSPLSSHTSPSSKTNNSTSTTSPTVPRALMQTPHAAAKMMMTTNSPSNSSKVEQAPIVEEVIHTTEEGSHCTIDEPSNEDKVDKNLTVSPSCKTSNENADTYDDTRKSEQVVEKTTKGGIAMDLTNLFSPESNGNKSQQQNQQEKKKIFTESTPLSSSIPAALLSRLTTNKQKSSSRQTQKKETRILSSIPKASVKSSKNIRDKKISTLNKTKSSNKISTKPSRNNKATDMVKPWKTSVSKSSKINKYGASKNLVKQSSIEEKVIVTDVKRGTTFTESRELSKVEDTIACERQSAASHRGGLAFDVGFNDTAEKSMTQLPSSRNKTITATNPSKTTTITKESNRNDVWAERQCESFVGWLNYTFNPEEMDIINEGSDAAGLRALLIHRRLAASRAKAFDLFRDDSMHQIRTIIVKEIARGKLSIRSDRDVTADIQLRKKLVSLLLSYTTPWLRMGLEVMFGECIEPVPISQKGPKVRSFFLLLFVYPPS